jgi:hypothetical protein
MGNFGSTDDDIMDAIGMPRDGSSSSPHPKPKMKLSEVIEQMANDPTALGGVEITRTMLQVWAWNAKALEAAQMRWVDGPVPRDGKGRYLIEWESGQVDYCFVHFSDDNRVMDERYVKRHCPIPMPLEAE